MPAYYPNWIYSNPYPTTYAGNNIYGTFQNTPTLQPVSGTPSPQQAIIWVEGEVGAKAYQMPQGWPANQPIPLWDNSDLVIYLKSWNQMGMPNPMQKLRYTMPEQQNPAVLPQGQSGENKEEYVKKSDMDKLMDEIRDLKESLNNRRNQNGQNNNRGGNGNA